MKQQSLHLERLAYKENFASLNSVSYCLAYAFARLNNSESARYHARSLNEHDPSSHLSQVVSDVEAILKDAVAYDNRFERMQLIVAGSFAPAVRIPGVAGSPVSKKCHCY